MQAVYDGLEHVMNILWDKKGSIGHWEDMKAHMIALTPGFATDQVFHDVGPTIFAIVRSKRAIAAQESKENDIGEPLDKLKASCLVVKVSRVNVTKDSKLADLDFEICGAYKGLDVAKREANQRLDEEILAAGGDARRVRNMYTVWPFSDYAYCDV